MQRRQETGTGQPYTPSVPGSQPSEPPYPVPSNTSTLYPTGTGTGTGGTAVPTPTGTLLYPGNAPVGVVVGDGIKCTTASFDMKWRVENFMYTSSDVYTTPANRILNGEVSFTLVNTALEAAYPESYVPARCDARSTRPEDLFYGDQTFGCTTEGDSRGLYSGLATFTWNKPAKTLTMTQMWKCEDYGYP